MSIHFAGSVLVLVVAALAGLAPVARAADGVVDLSWDTCSPIVVNVTSAGTGSMSLIASVIGNDQIHYGYQVRFQLGDPSNLVPDAWRFDGPGCQGSSALAINHMVPAALAGSCPVFHADRPSIFIKEYALFRPGSGHPTTLARGLLAIVYPVGTKAISEQRYFLAQFLFDHSQSVAGPTTQGTSCGGYESAIFVRLLNDPLPDGDHCSYVLLSDNSEHLFQIGNGLVTVNGAVPADRTTWGQVKNAYRR